jgi:drug/metabolite transporter (DMT)-like permease
MERYYWLMYAVFAGLCWGTYVPFVQQGILGFNRNAVASFLCVGIAYLLVAVLVPLGFFVIDERTRPQWTTYGTVFAVLAGIAGALGALCVILGNRAVGSMAADKLITPDEAVQYRMYIAPVIFALAPLINTLVSVVWHPTPEAIFHFELKPIGWKLILGIVLTGVGAALVLYSKEEAETSAKKAGGGPAAEKSVGKDVGS